FGGAWKGTAPPRPHLEQGRPNLPYLRPTEEEALRIWWETAAGEKWYSPAQILDLTTKATANPKRSAQFKDWLHGGLKVLVSGEIWDRKERPTAFSHLTLQVTDGGCVADKAAAA